MSTRIFALMMNRIIIQDPKIMREVTLSYSCHVVHSNQHFHPPSCYMLYIFIPISFMHQWYTKCCIRCHQFYLPCFVVIVDCPCSVTNTKCKPKIMCHSFYQKKNHGHYPFTVLQLSSLTKWFFIQKSIIIHVNLSLQNVRMQNIPRWKWMN